MTALASLFVVGLFVSLFFAWDGYILSVPLGLVCLGGLSFYSFAIQAFPLVILFSGLFFILATVTWVLCCREEEL